VRDIHHVGKLAETKTILRRTLMSIAASKGFEPLIDSHPRYFSNRVETCGCFPPHERRLMGSIHQIGSADFKSDSCNAKIICTHCDDKSDIPLRFLERLVPEVAVRSNITRIFRWVPHTYEALREHIERRHHPLLEYFVTGWETLSPELQMRWLGHNHFRMPTWRSWSSVVCRNRPQRHKMINQSTRLKKFVMSQLDDDGPLFGIPEMPAGFGGKVSNNNVARIVAEYMERVKDVGLRWLKEKIEKEGINALKGILNEEGVLVGELGGRESDGSDEEESDVFSYDTLTESDTDY